MINKLKTCNVNCNVYDVYDYNGLSLTDLLCQYYTKINECVDIGNEGITILDWLKDTGLPSEVHNQLDVWLQDGTLENIINNNLFEELTHKINMVKSRIVCVSDFGAVGDGITDDSRALMNAILSLKNSPVKTLHFENNKTYKIDTCLELEVDGITIEGNGATITTDNDNIGNMMINGVVGGQYHGYNGISNISINNLNFKGRDNGTSNCAISFGHGKNIRITNCNFYDMASHCMDISGIDGLFIENCRFLGSPVGTTTLREAIQFDYNSSPGFTVFGVFDKSQTKNVVIKNCVIGESSLFPKWERGIGAHTSFIENIFDNITIVNNIIDVNTCGVSFNGTNVTNLNVLNNKITSNANNGACIHISVDKRYCLPSENIHIKDNTCEGDYGVQFYSDIIVDSFNIINNRFKCKNTGVRVESDLFALSGLTIEGNKFNSVTTGIAMKVLNVVDVNIINNNIKNTNYASIEISNCDTCNISGNNIVYGFKYGILSDKLSNTVIQNNFISNMSSSAIVLNYSTVGNYTNNKIINNNISNIGYYGTPGAQNRGIQVDNTLMLSIDGNNITNVNALNNYIYVGNNVNGVISNNVLFGNDSNKPTFTTPSTVHNINNSLLNKL